MISATGVLSVPYTPGRARAGTASGARRTTPGEWPKEPVEFRGKRVAVIGTGASAVQLIPVIAEEVESLTVYQRTPNWCGPLNNGPISPEEQAEIKATYDEIYEACRSTFAGFLHRASRRQTFEDTKEERWALYEEVWNQRGFAKLLSNYRDLMTDRAANDEFSEFFAEKIRSRVDDPETAEKLIPKDHGFGMQRPPDGDRLLRGVQPPQRHPRRPARHADRGHHRGGIETVGGRDGLRHHRLGHRLRRLHRRAAAHGHRRRRRAVAA